MPIFRNIVEEYTNSLSCAPDKVLFFFSFLNKYPQALAGCFSRTLFYGCFSILAC